MLPDVSSVQLSERKRRHPAPVPYAAQRALPGVITGLDDIQEYMRQAGSKFEQRVDAALWDRFVLNSDPFDGGGTIDEHLAALRGIVGEIAAELGCLAIIGGELNEHNPGLEPPYQPLKAAPALREMLSRRMTELYGRMEQTRHSRGPAFVDWEGHKDEPYLIGDWPLVVLSRVATSYDSVNVGAELCIAREISAAALQEALTARRWPGVPVITRAMLDRAKASQLGEPAPLAISIARLADPGPWFGALSDLARAVGWSGRPEGLRYEIKRLAVDLLTLGRIVRPTGRRIGDKRLAEWCVEPSPATPRTPQPPALGS